MPTVRDTDLPDLVKGIVDDARDLVEVQVSSLKSDMTRALLVIDVQAGVVNDAHERDAVVARIAALVGDARRAGVPVVWVQHNDPGMAIGSADWALVPELVPADGEARIDKQKPSEDAHTTSDRVAVERENESCRERAAAGQPIELARATQALVSATRASAR